MNKEKTKEEVCALWRKAFLETLLLIRMEKENHNTRGEDWNERSDNVCVFVCGLPPNFI